MEREQADAGREGRARHARPCSLARTGIVKIYFSCSADHEQDWQPYPIDPYSALKVQANVAEQHFFPLTGGCSEGLGAFRFFFKHRYIHTVKREVSTVVPVVFSTEHDVSSTYTDSTDCPSRS